MIKVNEYFDGGVKSLGYENADGKSSVGVMAAGDYEFGTESKEIMTVVEGKLTIQQAGEEGWTDYVSGQSFEVPANSSFKLKVAENTAYLCQYR
ncbi:pyrimidine/purine nucleoside phosphorylase [Marinoscillum sp. MHG1-6]|uniref:pyrimidine/purine nucleoside phosphorylase n=1 Tax=Marinoscillum sp. MHG1-6 TaxID=2959627 RepID=UPI0021581A42|nr:pyrimidine/purine nucleoside phosphorylase [Marinoscillum sp. MHG1-6]